MARVGQASQARTEKTQDSDVGDFQTLTVVKREPTGNPARELIKVQKKWDSLHKAAGRKKALLALLDEPNELTPGQWVAEFMAASGTAKSKKALVALLKVVQPDLVIQGLQEFPDLWKVFAYLDAPEVFKYVDLKEVIDQDPEESFWKAFYEVSKFPDNLAKFAWRWKHDVVIPGAWLTTPILKAWVGMILRDRTLEPAEAHELVHTVITNLPAADKQKALRDRLYQEAWQRAVRDDDQAGVARLTSLGIPYEASGAGWQATPNPLTKALIEGSNQRWFNDKLINQLKLERHLVDNLRATWKSHWIMELALNEPTLEAMKGLGLDPWQENASGMTWMEWQWSGAAKMETDDRVAVEAWLARETLRSELGIEVGPGIPAIGQTNSRL